jgi:hypothetical protein
MEEGKRCKTGGIEGEGINKVCGGEMCEKL